MTRTVALTGATGFIGWHVARRFQQRGWRVRALVRPESARPVPDGVQRITTSLRQVEVQSACEGCDVIVHMAGAVGRQSDREFLRSNVDATGEVARAARALGIRLVHTSSLGLTGPRSPLDPPTEEDPLRPINMYGESKRQGEEIVRAVGGLAWVIVRPTLVYGPRDRLFYPLFQLARYGVFPVPNTKAVYNVVHVDDVARGIEMVAASGLSGETFFLGHPQAVSVTELLAGLASVFGTRFRPIAIPRIALRAIAGIGSLVAQVGIPMPLDRPRWRELDAEGFVCRIDKARDRAGFVAQIDLRDGLAETAEWYARNGWLKQWDVRSVRL